MKKSLFALLLSLSFAAAIAQPSLTLTLSTATVETSTKFLVYPVSDLYFIYNATTGNFQAREVNSNNLVYSAGIGTVAVDTFTVANSKIDALAASTHFRANMPSGLQYYLPEHRVSIRQRYPYVEIWAANGVSRTPIFSGKADDLSIETEAYHFKVGSTDFLITKINQEDEDFDIDVATGDSLGSGGSVTLTGNMLTGTITIASGTGPKSTGPLAEITLPRQMGSGYNLFLQEANAPAAIYRSRIYVNHVDGRVAEIRASGTALPNSTTLAYKYWIVGTLSEAQ